jgi:phosphoglycolate phosphatase-like HAD superfamily hydrolase
MKPHVIIVLDLDGVILKSNLIKYEAMLSLFTEHASKTAEISQFILANGGVPRREKLTRILADIVRVAVSSQVIESYLSRYAAALEHLIEVAPLVKGVESLLSETDYKFYVSSSAPETEVRQQLATRGLLERFSTVYASETRKAAALQQVQAQHAGATVVFFGDSVGDQEAAKAAGVAFVGVTAERDNFAGAEIIKLHDFSSPAEVAKSIHLAALQSAN